MMLLTVRYKCGALFSDTEDVTADMDTHPVGQSTVPSGPDPMFTDTDLPKDHLVDSSTDNLYKCTTRSKSFTRKSKWKYHICKHSTDNHDNKWICSTCGKYVSTKGGLKSHEKRHFEVKCENLNSKRALTTQVGMTHLSESECVCHV